MNTTHQQYNNLESIRPGCLSKSIFNLLITAKKKIEILLVPAMLWEIVKNFEPFLGGIITTKDLQTEYNHDTHS